MLYADVVTKWGVDISFESTIWRERVEALNQDCQTDDFPAKTVQYLQGEPQHFYFTSNSWCIQLHCPCWTQIYFTLSYVFERVGLLTSLCCFTDPTEKVQIEILSQRKTIKEGDNITLKCSGNGNPPPQEFLFFIPVSIAYLCNLLNLGKPQFGLDRKVSFSHYSVNQSHIFPFLPSQLFFVFL